MVGLAIATTGGCGESELAVAHPHTTKPSVARNSNGLTWSDEFDGPKGQAPDPAKWSHDIGGDGWGNNELQFYTDHTDNAALDGEGHLVITARAEDIRNRSCWYGPCGYSSARLSTGGRFAQAYGTFEARIRLPRGSGLLPAFWLIGDNIHDVGWPSSGEIDVMEYPGKERGTIYGGMHGPGHDRNAGYPLPGGGAFGDDFHTYTLVWAPDSLGFLVDGVEYFRVTRAAIGADRWVYDHPFFIVLDVAVGGKWPGSPDRQTAFPQQMVVDYVRAYSWWDNGAPSSKPATTAAR